ncbi:MAG: hypothetical protein M3R70_11660 [Actinomycetota bacterium]|nr:hypothetical protein [Actinomycetota bacterium]
MPGRTYPSYATCLVAVCAGAALSAWLVIEFHALTPSLSSQAWSIIACAVSALAVKTVLRTFGYDAPFFAAAGALLAQRVVGYALVSATASLSTLGPFELPPAFFAAAPGALLGAMVVQLTATRQHAASRGG